MKNQIACLLLVLFSASELYGYLTFNEKHVNKEMKPDECNRRMENINGDLKACKPINTFILEEGSRVNDVCKEGKENELIQSSSKFNVVECKHVKTSVYPECKYKHRNKNGFIKIICKSGEPVHYDGTVDQNAG